MAPKADKAPATFVFGRNRVFEDLIAEYETLGYIKKGKGRAAGSKTVPKPCANKVVVFPDLFCCWSPLSSGYYCGVNTS
jgi:hypothetical protein